jgi:hypothetical protein
MTPYRNAVRAHLHAIGASPAMCEEITPRDKGPQRAYLNPRWLLLECERAWWRMRL